MISVSLSGTGKQQGEGAGLPDNFGHCLALSFCSLCVLLLFVVVVVAVCVVACVCSRAQKGKTAQKLAATFDQDQEQDMRLIFKFKSHFLSTLFPLASRL